MKIDYCMKHLSELCGYLSELCADSKWHGWDGKVETSQGDACQFCVDEMNKANEENEKVSSEEYESICYESND